MNDEKEKHKIILIHRRNYCKCYSFGLLIALYNAT